MFRKCTIAVKAIDVSRSKNKAKTGSNKVPKPKPEKKVSKDAIKETDPITKNITIMIDDNLLDATAINGFIEKGDEIEVVNFFSSCLYIYM